MAFRYHIQLDSNPKVNKNGNGSEAFGAMDIQLEPDWYGTLMTRPLRYLVKLRSLMEYINPSIRWSAHSASALSAR